MFVFYGLDVAALAFVTAVIAQVLKKTALKNVPNKLYTFLPFIIGALLYAAYESICRSDWLYCFHNFASVLEYGAIIGALSTCIYVLYEQFIRGNGKLSRQSVIESLLEGYVAEENAASAAALIAEAIEGGADESAEAVAQIIKDNAETASDGDVQLLAELIVKTLATLSVED